MTTVTGEHLPFQTPQGGPRPNDPVLPTPGKLTTAAKAPERTLAVRDFSMLIALLAIGAFFSFMVPSFLGSRNLSMVAIELSITAVLALGMLLILLPGHIDLSAGSSAALFGGISAVFIFNQGWPAPLAMAASFAAALVVYWLMGLLIVKQEVPAFIITLGGLLVFRGLQWKVIENATIPVSAGGQPNFYSLLTTYYVPPMWSWVLAGIVITVMGLGAWISYRHRRALPGVPVDGELSFMQWLVSSQLIALFVLICNQYRGLPMPVLILGVTALFVFVLTSHTTWGRYLYAIGGNQEAAHVSGVPVRRVVIGAFVIMGAIVCLTGFLQTAYAGASTTTIGNLLELDAIAACVIGGTSLRGGRGTVSGVLFGALIMAVLLNGMTLMAVSPEMKYIARGSVLALAVWMDVRLSRR